MAVHGRSDTLFDRVIPPAGALSRKVTLRHAGGQEHEADAAQDFDRFDRAAGDPAHR